jgi:hypothetical protein
MATSAAIAATTSAVRTVLDRTAAAPVTGFPGVTVSAFGAAELQSPPSSESSLVLSVFLYRVTLSTTRSSTPAIVTRGGERVRAPIPLDLHYLVTAWAKSPPMQQKLLGFAIRALEDMPVLPPAVLNDGGWDGTFRADEAVELVWQPLSPSEEFDLWQVAQTSQQPSASYVARGVEIDSAVPAIEGPLVQTVELEYGEAVQA